MFDKTKSKKADKDIYTVVQPDLCVICDLGKLDERGCLGAPDLIVEILSPGNSSREMKVKKNIYEEAGVLEYWIIDPNQENLVRYNLQEDGFYGRPLIFVSSEKVPSVVFPDLLLDLNELFPEKTEEDL